MKPREHLVPLLSRVLFYISGFAENTPSHCVQATRRTEVTFACLGRWDEMRRTHPLRPHAAEQTSVHLSPLAVNRPRGTCDRLRWHEVFLHLRKLHLHFILGEPMRQTENGKAEEETEK